MIKAEARVRAVRLLSVRGRRSSDVTWCPTVQSTFSFYFFYISIYLYLYMYRYIVFGFVEVERVHRCITSSKVSRRNFTRFELLRNPPRRGWHDRLSQSQISILISVRFCTRLRNTRSQVLTIVIASS